MCVEFKPYDCPEPVVVNRIDCFRKEIEGQRGVSHRLLAQLGTPLMAFALHTMIPAQILSFSFHQRCFAKTGSGRTSEQLLNKTLPFFLVLFSVTHLHMIPLTFPSTTQL